MKDNRKSPFVSDLTKEVHTSQGIKRFPTLTHITFNNFYGDDSSSGSLIKGSTLSDMYEIVEGQSSAAGAMSSSTAILTDFEVYGETVYTNQELYEGIYSTLSMKQRGLRLPLEGSASAATGKKLVVKRNVNDLDPAQAGQTGRCFMLKIKVGQSQNNQALLSIGNPPTGAVSFNIAFTSSGNLQFSHFGSGGSSAQQTWSMNPADRDRWVTIFVQPYLSVGNAVQLLGTRIYDAATGKLISTTATASGTGTNLDIGTQKNLYIGYGENTGGVNVAFDLADFLCDVDIAEVTVFERMISEAEADLIARSHLKENAFKSGFNNRAPRKTQQLLDARSSYPISANPALPKEPSSAFNDTTTKVFGTPIGSQKSEIMYPEALPALMFSGSSASRGAVGDSNSFYRDIHNTPYENRIVAPGALAQGVSHKETELLNLSSRNSPVSISQDTQVLGGTITPFNDTSPLVNKGAQVAVDETVYPGLQQRLSDHVAIVIDLDPYADSTIGVERDAAGRPTGRVTSIAYFNFETKKWETQGKNNDFIIQGPKSIRATGSLTYNQIDDKENDTLHYGPNILNDTSLAFAGTSGFSIFVDEQDEMSLASLSQRGMPTSNYGFPIHQKYEAKDDQLIDMSKYIDAPFLLERVGFEFGAAIEESGPHSLGYKMKTAAPGTSAAKMLPAAQAKPSAGASFYESRIHTTRSPFINGSIINPVYKLNKSGLISDSFVSSSAVDVSGIAANLAGTPYTTQLRPTEIAVIDTTTNASATSFLKTSVGPRGFNNGISSGGAQNKATRKLIDKLTSTGAPVSYIPVVAGGVNGVVTGSNSEWLAEEVGGSYPTGPHVVLEPNFEDPLVSGAPFAYSTDGSQSSTPKGGTPFWRADSFFLIRQLPSDSVAASVTKSVYKFTVASDTGMTPLAPYQGALQLYARGIYNYSTLTDSETLSTIFGKSGLLSGSSSPVNPVLEVATSLDTNRLTTRELITFGQMSHFGYANAYDSTMDTIWDSSSDHQFASGSIDSIFKDQIFGPANNPRMLPLFGQAIKYAAYPDFSWATVPANPEQVKEEIGLGNPSNISVFSDLPDSFQGQYAVFPIPDPDPSITRNWGLAIDDWYTAPGYGRNIYGNARYAASGAQNYDTTVKPSLTRTHLSSMPHTAYTLDTYTSYPTVESPNWITGHQTVTSSSPPNLTGFPVGSGFSMISTPAFFTEINPTLSSGGYKDFDELGTFYEPGSRRGTKSWMDSGLSRDLNVELTRGHKHQGVNIDFTDNWCGFTLMTASTTWRPLESPGRESASLPLQANVYKRQYLNFQRDFKIEAPVRAVSPSGVEPGGFWNFTSPNSRTREMSEPGATRRRIHKPRSNAYYSNYPGGTLLEFNGDTGDPSRPLREESAVALEAKRYHKTYSMNLVQGGFIPGPNQGGTNSSRMFVGQAPALEPKRSITQSTIPFGGTPFYRAGDPQYNGTILDSEFDRMLTATRLSGSAPTNPVKDALYILQPGDKLALGVQPALPGWNPGSGMPNNRWAKKYGVWDYNGDNKLGAQPADVDSTGAVIDDPMVNLQDPYEPAHGLTMLAGPSRVILYGSFLRDNKHYSNSSTQKIRSNAVHEALHYDNPVLDQFNIEPGSAHKSSYLTQLITGSILDVGDPRDGEIRGVAARLSDGNLVFSGSFQRFTRASEDSQIFYDTLPISPFDIARRDGGYFLESGGPVDESNYVIVNLHMNNPVLVASSSEVLGSASVFNDVYTHALSNLWADSFPFDRYSQYTRLATPSLKFGSELPNAVCRMNLPEVSPGGPQTTASTKDYYNDNYPTYSPSPQSNLSGSHTRMSPQFYDTEILPWFQTTFPARSNLFPPLAINATGVDIITITNSAKVRQATFREGMSTPNTDWKPYPPENTENNQRMFWMSILGYGRQNRKQLDLNRIKSLDIVHNSFSGLVQTRGGAVYDHPAGFKYGYMNSFRLSPSAVHRADRYGQFRDMLEQRLYGKTYSTGDEFTNRGQTSPAVTCIFVDADGAPISDSTQTQCLNLSTAMTSSKPYIEGEVMREIIFSSESVTIE